MGIRLLAQGLNNIQEFKAYAPAGDGFYSHGYDSTIC